MVSIWSSFLLVFFTTTVFGGHSSGPVTESTTGPIRGVTLNLLDSQVDAYLGVPYALPPVGELRFKRPKPIHPWSDVYNATAKPPPCYQLEMPENSYLAPDVENMTEDCLYLNLWVPRTQSPDPKAIMVWIHGGSFQIGSSGMEEYDGAVLAAYGDVIVSSMNYRLGALGFFFSGTGDATGSMGIHDQILALKWINDNAARFGGDKSRITIFGESAGAYSISNHLMSPVSRSLFTRAILQSGADIHPSRFLNATYQQNVSNSMAERAGCTTTEADLFTDPDVVMQCMRSLPAANVTAAQVFVQSSQPDILYAVFGDDLIPLETTVALREYPRDKDILVGITKDEGSFFMVASMPEYFGRNGQDVVNLTDSLAESLLQEAFERAGEADSEEMAKYYVKNSKSNLRKGMYDAFGDFYVACGSVFFADLYSIDKTNTHFYQFNHRSSITPTAEWMGVIHGMEIPFVLGHPLKEEYNFTSEDKQVSCRMMNRWSAFAKTGNPDVAGSLKWPFYSYDYPAYLTIAAEETIQLHPTDGRCEFWRDKFRANVD